jgi:hypothetical protein
MQTKSLSHAANCTPPTEGSALTTDRSDMATVPSLAADHTPIGQPVPINAADHTPIGEHVPINAADHTPIG